LNDTEKQKIMNIFTAHDIDPLLPMRISPLHDSSASSASSREPSSEALGRVTPLKMRGKLKAAIDFSRISKLPSVTTE
jgi:hypothetical protein